MLCIGKLGNSGAVTTDTCNPAMKLGRLLEDKILVAAAAMRGDSGASAGRVLKVDCYNHLRNVWFGGMTKSMSGFLTSAMRGELEAIDSKLRVNTSVESVLRAVDKEFSFCANYPKGHAELFYEWMKIKYPDALLLHVHRMSGGRQDAAVEGAGALFFNRRYYVEFLDERLTYVGPDGNILQASTCSSIGEHCTVCTYLVPTT